LPRSTKGTISRNTRVLFRILRPTLPPLCLDFLGLPSFPQHRKFPPNYPARFGCKLDQPLTATPSSMRLSDTTTFASWQFHSLWPATHPAQGCTATLNKHLLTPFLVLGQTLGTLTSLQALPFGVRLRSPPTPPTARFFGPSNFRALAFRSGLASAAGLLKQPGGLQGHRSGPPSVLACLDWQVLETFPLSLSFPSTGGSKKFSKKVWRSWPPPPPLIFPPLSPAPILFFPPSSTDV